MIVRVQELLSRDLDVGTDYASAVASGSLENPNPSFPDILTSIPIQEPDPTSLDHKMAINIAGDQVNLLLSGLIPGREYWAIKSADFTAPINEWETIYTVTPEATPGDPDALVEDSYGEPMDGPRGFYRLATEALP